MENARPDQRPPMPFGGTVVTVCMAERFGRRAVAGRDRLDVAPSMNISEPFIRRPIATSLLMLGVLVFGIGAYRLLPVAALPNVDFPTITVTAQLSRRQARTRWPRRSRRRSNSNSPRSRH